MNFYINLKVLSHSNYRGKQLFLDPVKRCDIEIKLQEHLITQNSNLVKYFS